MRSASWPHKSSNQGRIASETSRATIQQAFYRIDFRVIPIRLTKHFCLYFGTVQLILHSRFRIGCQYCCSLSWSPTVYVVSHCTTKWKSLVCLMLKILTRTETTFLLHVLIKCGILDENLWGIDNSSERWPSCHTSSMPQFPCKSRLRQIMNMNPQIFFPMIKKQ